MAAVGSPAFSCSEVWVFISAFLWPHTLGERTDTWIIGVLIAIVSVVAMFLPAARLLNTLLAVWLFFATWIIGHASPATAWSNTFAALAVFVMAHVPTRARRR